MIMKFLKLCPNSINPIKCALWVTSISIFSKTPQIRENLKKTLCTGLQPTISVTTHHKPNYNI